MIARVFVVAAFMAVAADSPARAAQSSSASQLRWYDAYDQGVAAVQKRDWKTAEQRLNEARTANPKQGRNVLAYGDRYVTYLPDYYLGIVYLNTNRSRQAEEAFGRISTQKLIAANNPEYKAFDQHSRQATFDRAFGEAVGLVAKGDFAQASGPLEQARATRIDDGKVNNLSAEIAKSASAKVVPPTTRASVDDDTPSRERGIAGATIDRSDPDPECHNREPRRRTWKHQPRSSQGTRKRYGGKSRCHCQTAHREDSSSRRQETSHSAGVSCTSWWHAGLLQRQLQGCRAAARCRGARAGRVRTGAGISGVRQGWACAHGRSRRGAAARSAGGLPVGAGSRRQRSAVHLS
jgi:tetratricopeptide (TPR) repeat protein